jgi:hypothetical protein
MVKAGIAQSSREIEGVVQFLNCNKLLDCAPCNKFVSVSPDMPVTG